MSDIESMRHDIVTLVRELRATLEDIGSGDLPQGNLVSDARDRLRYISALTEQAAGRTLSAAEAIADRLRAQQAAAAALARRTRSPQVRAFLDSLVQEHRMSAADTGEIIEAQAFQDLVGQVVNKLMLTVQRMEDNLLHLLVEPEADADPLAGPALTPRAGVSQAEIDDLFG
jgi:chemotaxis protein CheZ